MPIIDRNIYDLQFTSMHDSEPLRLSAEEIRDLRRQILRLLWQEGEPAGLMRGDQLYALQLAEWGLIISGEAQRKEPQQGRMVHQFEMVRNNWSPRGQPRPLKEPPPILIPRNRLPWHTNASASLVASNVANNPILTHPNGMTIE